jgi:hypothetical protein
MYNKLQRKSCDMTEDTYVAIISTASGVKRRRGFAGVTGGCKTARQTSKPTATVQAVSKKTSTPTPILWAKGREGRAKYRAQSTSSRVYRAILTQDEITIMLPTK